MISSQGTSPKVSFDVHIPKKNSHIVNTIMLDREIL